MKRSNLAMALSCLSIAAPPQNDTTVAQMKTPPNKTAVTGRLQNFEPAVHGYGADLEIEVLTNDSPDRSADFIKPEAGSQLRAFYPEASERDISLLIGRVVKVDLTFLGGPSGGRAVVQSLRAVSPPR